MILAAKIITMLLILFILALFDDGWKQDYKSRY